jgi:hypothetical protein
MPDTKADTKIPEVFFSPSSIVAIFNAATVTKEEKRIIHVRGIFKKSGTANYGGNFYNRLKDEAGENSITLITSELMHNQLEDNKTIEFNAFITRRLDKQGRIELIINLIELFSQKVNKYSEEETKKIVLINRKVETGFKDLDALIKNRIFNNLPIKIKIIMGKSGIIDTDIKKGMGEAIALYNIEYHKVSLSAPEEIISKIKTLDTTDADIICLARGGGENLDTFENLNICESILSRKTIIASAIGHAQDVSLFEKLADKKFITPTHFGTYLKEIYNNTIEEFENSKAKLAQEITTQLTANFSKQIQNLNEQLLATKELHEKTKSELAKNHSEQLITLQTKLKNSEELYNKTTQEKLNLHKTETENLKKQIQDTTELYQKKLTELTELEKEKMLSLTTQVQTLQEQQKQKDKMIEQTSNLASTYQKQLSEAKSSSNSGIIIAAIIAIIIGIIIGMSLSK